MAKKTKQAKKTEAKEPKSLVLTLAALIVVLSGALIWMLRTDQGPTHTVDPNAPITSFEECKAAGYPIAESYPEQCFADGKSFVNQTQ